MPWDSFVSVVSYPISPDERFFWLYVVTSVVIALAVAFIARRQQGQGGGSLWSAVFPGEIWRHPSSQVDLRYFLPHQMVRVWIYSGLIFAVWLAVSKGTEILAGRLIGPVPATEEVSRLVLVVYTMASMLVADFALFFMHYLQHRVPVLWAFHKVHHSATVLNPFSNYREHPVDNISYALVFGTVTGLSAGAMLGFIGGKASLWTVMGVAMPSFLFNILGYHLRHSHVWLRWPGALGLLFGSPAHHQIHHSCRPEHINRNMAFMFPVWDVLFGTYCLPPKKPELVFGLGDGTEEQYNSFLRIYALPFEDVLKRESAESS